MKRLLLIFLLLTSTAQAQAYRYLPVITSPFVTTTSGSMTAFTLNDTDMHMGFILQAKEAATITQLCFTYGLRALTPPTYKIGMETITSGFPSGTYLTGTGECSNTFTPPASTAWDGTKQCVTLTGTTCNLTRGQEIAITIRYSSGTINGTNNSSFVYRASTSGDDGNDLQSNNSEYGYTFPHLGANTRQPYTPVISYENGSRAFGNPLLNFGSTAYSSGTEYALRFQYPCPAGQTFYVAGMIAAGKTPSTTKTLKFKILSGTTVIQGPYTMTSDKFGSGVGSYKTLHAYFTDTSLTALSCGTTYYASVESPDAASGWEILTNTVSANSDFDAWPLGIQTYMGNRSGGAWTDTTTVRPRISLILDSHGATAAGGLLNNNTMSGGTQ